MLELDARDKNRLAQSSIIAAAVWLVMLIIFTLLPVMRDVPEERAFPEVRITLNREDPVPVQTRTVAPATSSAEPAVRPAAARQEKSAQKPANAPPVRQKTSSGLGIPDFQSTSGREAAAPSGEYLDFSSDRPREQTVQEPGPVLREFEGSAARVDEPAARQGTATVEGGSRVSAASDETLQALDRIRAGNEGGVTVPDGAASTSPASTTGRTADTDVATTPGMVGPITFEGTARRLLYPAKPGIILPPHLARLIDSDRSVTVLFVVRADGSVPASLVRFSPSALLPPEVQNYLKNEFSTWRFERGSDDGQARFLYSITVQ
ncbi:MAG TPA: hypothetical protein PLV73_04435 [Treponemataceae bacterium]|jgi:hypothetical protein|nr:hypothetical protein [Treponema sp.]OQB04252.1 MAG: hypothetical protein BWY20_00883 [Spirochaetes bacterium ADurb.Bin215]HPA10053.1 hypothetical protein [Treponemataceae bacterium]